MGMREELQAELGQAFDDPDGLADAVKAVRGERTTEGEYDPVTGETSGTIVSYRGRGVIGSYLSREINGTTILTADEKLLAIQNELFLVERDTTTAAQATPQIGDAINGYRVVNVSQDPTEATWTIQLRK